MILQILDDKAEATAAGKITRIINKIGIPGGVAFKAGTSLAKSSLKQKSW